MSWNSKVIWSEGMFLQPQHLQQHDRYIEKLLEGRTRPIAAYGWGFSALVLDEAALALGKVAISSARGIFPDGTPFDFPADNAAPLAFDFPADAKDEVVVLALPLRRDGSLEADLAGDDPSALTRYATSEFDVMDNTLASAQAALVQVGDLRMKLMLKRDITDAYATLNVVRAVERRADNQLVLDKAYIGPTLASGENGILAGYVREIHGLLHQRGEALGHRLSQPGRGGVAEIADFLLLQTVNRHEPAFKHLGEISVLHPRELFGVCVMLAGELCTFSRESRRPPDYPEYIHDEPHLSFGPVMADLRRSLSMVLEQTAIAIELQDRKYGVRVAIIPDAELLRSA
ncbi:MAG TPA: type VI secretion system baseplate subunit TssK, partial [Rhodocyclaceae bacterium]|nr:type VI secretion system baseplate subunit TssK [Rhodocyclaceae bacterium]